MKKKTGIRKRKNLKAESKLKEGFADKQVIILIGYLKDNEKYGYVLPIIEFLNNTHCRINEVLAMKWSDINFENNIISVNHTLSKTHGINDSNMKIDKVNRMSNTKIRKISISDDLREQLLGQKKYHIQQPGNNHIKDNSEFSSFVFYHIKRKIIR